MHSSDNLGPVAILADMADRRRDTLRSLYARENLIDMPIYSLAVVARYLKVPLQTARSWVLGRDYPTKAGPKRFPPLIQPADPAGHYLSFRNLAEIHVLDSIRRDDGIPIAKVREALDYLREHLNSAHPLADRRMETDGVDLFLREYRRLTNLNRQGQYALKELMDAYVHRLDWDRKGLAIRLFPFYRDTREDEALFDPGREPRAIVIDPKIAFGRPVLVGSGVPTSTIAERHSSGESVEELAADYDESVDNINEAIRAEGSGREAAA
jgi:uncharacterized protein (DUF433 family)